LSSSSDTFKDGWLGIGQNKSLLKVLSRRISLKVIRGATEEDYYGSSMRSTLARKNQVQEAKMAICRIGCNVTTSCPWLVIPKTNGRNAGSKTRDGRKYGVRFYVESV